MRPEAPARVELTPLSSRVFLEGEAHPTRHDHAVTQRIVKPIAIARDGALS